MYERCALLLLYMRLLFICIKKCTSLTVVSSACIRSQKSVRGAGINLSKTDPHDNRQAAMKERTRFYSRMLGTGH